jgi:ribosomal protein S18 acetylase RimI-like enzyme
MAFQIRTYEAPDWASVCKVYDAAKPDELQGLVDRSAILPLADDPQMKALFQASAVDLAEKAGQVLGFAGTRGDTITWLFVHPAHRRKGVAGELLRHILRRLDGVATLHVAKGNQPALRLYEQFGFSAESEFAGHFNGHAVQVLRLRWTAV